MDEERKILLVLDARYKKIFSYSMETDPPTRLDDHTNDKVKATDEDTDPNADDFFLFKNKASATGETTYPSEFGRTRQPCGCRTWKTAKSMPTI